MTKHVECGRVRPLSVSELARAQFGGRGAKAPTVLGLREAAKAGASVRTLKPIPSYSPNMNPTWYAFARAATKNFYYGALGGLRSVGEENIPREGALILAPNHVSYLDPPAVACGTKRRRLRFMAKEELFKSPLGALIASLGAFPVKRGEGDTESIRKALAILEAGEALLIFPEGSRGDGVSMGPINRGVAMMAKRTNAPVMPVGIIGTHIVKPRGAPGRKHPMLVAYGKPFTYEELATGANERENRERFAAELEARIIALCAAHGLTLRSASSIENPPAAVGLGQPPGG